MENRHFHEAMIYHKRAPFYTSLVSDGVEAWELFGLQKGWGAAWSNAKQYTFPNNITWYDIRILEYMYVSVYIYTVYIWLH